MVLEQCWWTDTRILKTTSPEHCLLHGRPGQSLSFYCAQILLVLKGCESAMWLQHFKVYRIYKNF